MIWLAPLFVGLAATFYPKDTQSIFDKIKSFLLGGISFTPVTTTQQITANNTDLDTLARTVWGEARGEGYSGMQAVANVIMNRYRQAQNSEAKARQFGRTVSEICKKKYQFSAWLENDPNYQKLLTVDSSNAQFRTALEIADLALRGRLPDITGGADHYHTAAVNPAWSQGENPVRIINSHQFYRLT